MNTYLIKLQYQGDDRCEDSYRAYCKTNDEDEVEDKVLLLSNFDELEWSCIENYKDYFEEDEDQYASVYVENISNEFDIIDSPWFKSLEILIDERSSN